jgi:uracil-DNA glycosylase
MKPPTIDHDALDRIRKAHYRWRHGRLSLSDCYVPGEGNHPYVMLIGEAPGAQEDAKGRPFVGDSGLVLRELMTLSGLYTGTTPHFGEANCWLTNVVKFRPPGNRTPTTQEIMSVRKYLRAEWVAIGQPQIIVPVGGVALHAVYGRKLSILAAAGTMRGEFSRDGMGMVVCPMLHPSYGLRGGKKVQDLMEAQWEELGKYVKDYIQAYRGLGA